MSSKVYLSTLYNVPIKTVCRINDAVLTDQDVSTTHTHTHSAVSTHAYCNLSYVCEGWGSVRIKKLY